MTSLNLVKSDPDGGFVKYLVSIASVGKDSIKIHPILHCPYKFKN